MAQSPTTPSGMRDFAPPEVARRNFIFDIVKEQFRLCGFMPIETPAMENLSTLLGKYGDEGDKLLFKVLNSGSAFAKISSDNFSNPSAIAAKVCEKGLRYDLTVPFARYVAQRQNDIVFPLRRYQVQPVWRADRPQKGRYREFYQCDADIIGSNSLLCEAELVQMTDSIFHLLGVCVRIKINSRKIIYGIAEILGAADKFTSIATIIDKIEKIGREQALAEMEALGISIDNIAQIQDILMYSQENISIQPNRAKIDRLRTFFTNSQTGLAGVEEVAAILDYLDIHPPHCSVEFDPALARGLNYYTGAIFEVKAIGAAIGSICGGGRYDNLTGVFGLNGMSGVGISFGADRIYDVMLAQGLFPQNIEQIAQIIFINMGGEGARRSFALAQTLRQRGIAAEMYPDARKLQKQMDYANRRSIPYVGVIGEDELLQDKISVKDMRTGQQKMVTEESLVEMLA